MWKRWKIRFARNRCRKLIPDLIGFEARGLKQMKGAEKAVRPPEQLEQGIPAGGLHQVVRPIELGADVVAHSVSKYINGSLLTYDALKMSFRKIEITRNRECAVCGKHPTTRPRMPAPVMKNI